MRNWTLFCRKLPVNQSGKVSRQKAWESSLAEHTHNSVSFVWPVTLWLHFFFLSLATHSKGMLQHHWFWTLRLRKPGTILDTKQWSLRCYCILKLWEHCEESSHARMALSMWIMFLKRFTSQYNNWYTMHRSIVKDSWVIHNSLATKPHLTIQDWTEQVLSWPRRRRPDNRKIDEDISNHSWIIVWIWGSLKVRLNKVDLG